MQILQSIRVAFSVHWKRTLYILFVAQLLTSFGFSSMFPFLPLYVKDLGSSMGLSLEFLAGMVFSGQGLTMMIASPLWGTVADRYGRKLMVERAMFGGTIILLLMAFVRSAEELVLLRAIQGFITGTVSAANALVAGVTPREHTGYAMGLLQVGMGVGVAAGPLAGGLIADLYGYSAAFYVTSAMLFFGGLLVLFGIDENFQPAAIQNSQRVGLMGSWRTIVATPGVLGAYGMRFISQLGQQMILPIAPLFIEALMGSNAAINTFTGLASGLASATATVSAIFLGRLGDRAGHRRILIISMTTAVLFYLPQTFVFQAWQLLALQALAGIALGGIVTSISALLAAYTRPGQEGAVYGLDNSIVSGARSLAPLIGSGVAIWLGLRQTFLATALLFVAGALLAARARPPAAKSELPYKVTVT